MSKDEIYQKYSICQTNQWNKSTVDKIDAAMDEYASQQTSELKAENEDLKALLRWDNCPEIVIENPGMCLRPAKPSKESIEWAQDCIRRYELSKDSSVIIPQESYDKLTTTLSLIRPLAFADQSSVEYNMEEIRKILNEYYGL